MAGHPTPVVNNSWNVAINRETTGTLKFNTQMLNRCDLYFYCLHLSAKSDSLSVSFQLADLKEDHEVVLGVTGSCSGASQSAELRGRHCTKEEEAD